MKKIPVIVTVILAALILAVTCWFSVDRSHAASKKAVRFATCLSEGNYKKAYRMLSLPEGSSLSAEDFEAEGTLLRGLLLQGKVPDKILVSDPFFTDAEEAACSVTVTFLSGSEAANLHLELAKDGRTWKIRSYSQGEEAL